MLEEIVLDGTIRNKVDIAIERLRAFEPEDGYYVAFSGGKDSVCILKLCKMAGVKFEAHYNVTSVDPPELVQFIKDKYPEVSRDVPLDKDGEPITMWNLIPKKKMPPTRLARYCCEVLKESAGKGRVTVTGVRWAESARRAESAGTVGIVGKVDGVPANAMVNKQGGIILNDDNDEARRFVEHCFRTFKTLVNPIVDWEDENSRIKADQSCIGTITTNIGNDAIRNGTKIIEPGEDGVSNSLTSVQKDNYVCIPQATEKGYIECEVGGVADLSYPNSATRRGRVQDRGSVSPTVTAECNGLCRIESQFRIRKLTPKECWRLMGFSDEDFERAEKVNSNSQLYKQAGNSIVVNVLMEIFKEMIE